jgi:hypothetical protein
VLNRVSAPFQLTLLPGQACLSAMPPKLPEWSSRLAFKSGELAGILKRASLQTDLLVEGKTDRRVLEAVVPARVVLAGQ